MLFFRMHGVFLSLLAFGGNVVNTIFCIILGKADHPGAIYEIEMSYHMSL